MANVYCVSYDLRGDPAEYSGLYNVLTSAKHWWHYLESTWIVVFDDAVKELREKLDPHLNDGDRLLIISVGPDYAGWLPDEAWDWIKRNVNSLAPQTV